MQAVKRRRETVGLNDPVVAAFCDSCEFLSLGCYCGPACTLKSLGLKKVTYPFDWVRTPADGVIHCLQTNFEDLKEGEGPSMAAADSTWHVSLWVGCSKCFSLPPVVTFLSPYPNSQQDPRPRSSQQRQPNQQQPDKQHTIEAHDDNDDENDTTNRKTDPPDDQSNNTPRTTSNCAAATLFYVSETHHHFLQQEQASSVQVARNLHRKQLDKSFCTMRAIRQTGSGPVTLALRASQSFEYIVD